MYYYMATKCATITVKREINNVYNFLLILHTANSLGLCFVKIRAKIKI